jgi:hypothetical protein
VSTWLSIAQQLSGRRSVRWALGGALVAGIALGWTAAGNAAPAHAPDRVPGWQVKLGNGEATSFAQFQPNGAPEVIGLSMSAEALATLPSDPSDRHHCVDRDGDGAVAHATECVHTHEFVIPLPDSVAQRNDIPFKWVLLNWNAHGHVPPGIYDVPHFDVHFMIAPIQDIFSIGDGTCGPEFVDCNDYAVAKKPVPDGMMHPDFSDVDGVVPAMGNHLVDLTGHEFHGAPFTRSWIYGAYDGRVTFYEEMVALNYLRMRPDDCSEIKFPPAVQVSGYYPTERCVRYDASTNSYIVAMEQFVYREAN